MHHPVSSRFLTKLALADPTPVGSRIQAGPLTRVSACKTRQQLQSAASSSNASPLRCAAGSQVPSCEGCSQQDGRRLRLVGHHADLHCGQTSPVNGLPQVRLQSRPGRPARPGVEKSSSSS